MALLFIGILWLVAKNITLTDADYGFTLNDEQ
jgi:hypothetical protein